MMKVVNERRGGVNRMQIITALHYVDQHRFPNIYDEHDDHVPNEWHNLGMQLY